MIKMLNFDADTGYAACNLPAATRRNKNTTFAVTTNVIVTEVTEMKIDQELLSKIAHLARLEIRPGEETKYIESMDSVLTWMDQLNEIDTEGIEPLTHITREVNQWREDVEKNTLSREDAVSNAPAKTDTYIKVPKVIE